MPGKNNMRIRTDLNVYDIILILISVAIIIFFFLVNYTTMLILCNEADFNMRSFIIWLISFAFASILVVTPLYLSFLLSCGIKKNSNRLEKAVFFNNNTTFSILVLVITLLAEIFVRVFYIIRNGGYNAFKIGEYVTFPLDCFLMTCPLMTTVLTFAVSWNVFNGYYYNS